MIKLIFKEAVYNLRRKAAFYFSFFCFLIIVMGIIISLLSFGLNFGNYVNKVKNIAPMTSVLKLNDRNKIWNNNLKGEDEKNKISDQGIKALTDFVNERNWANGANKNIRITLARPIGPFDQPTGYETFKNMLYRKSGYINQEWWTQKHNSKWITGSDFHEKMEPKTLAEFRYYNSNFYLWYLFKSGILNENDMFYNADFQTAIFSKQLQNSRGKMMFAFNTNFFTTQKNNSKFIVLDGEWNAQSGIYVTQKTLHANNLKIGDDFIFEFDGQEYIEKIVGTGYNAQTLQLPNSGWEPIFLTNQAFDNLAWITNQNEISEYHPYRILREKTEIEFGLKNNFDFDLAMNRFANELFYNENQPPNLPTISPLTIQNLSLDIIKTDDISMLFGSLLPNILVLASILMIAILCIINWLVTNQSARLNIKNLVTLKNEGVSTFYISLLNTFELFFPLIFASIFGIFIALAFQNFISSVVFSFFSFHWSFFYLTWITWVSIFGSIIIVFATFAMINIFIINKLLKTHKQEVTSWSAKIISQMTAFTSPKIRIRSHMILSNLGRGFSVFVITGIALTAVLFTINLSISFKDQAEQVKRIYDPYKSISFFYYDENGLKNDGTLLNSLMPKETFTKNLTEEIFDECEQWETISGLDFNLQKFATWYASQLDERPKATYGYMTEGYVNKMLVKYEWLLKQNMINVHAHLDALKQIKAALPPGKEMKFFVKNFFIDEEDAQSGLLINMQGRSSKNNRQYATLYLDRNTPWADQILPPSRTINDDGTIDVAITQRQVNDGNLQLNDIINVYDDSYYWRNSDINSDPIYRVSLKFKVTKIIKNEVYSWRTFVDKKIIDQAIYNYFNKNPAITYPGYDGGIKFRQNTNFVLSKSTMPFFLNNIILNNDIYNLIRPINGGQFYMITKEIYQRSEFLRNILLFISVIVMIIDVLTIILLASIVVYHNKPMLTIMKTFGYKRFELTLFIGIGYFLAILAGMFLAIGLVFWLYQYLSTQFISSFGSLKIILGPIFFGSLFGFTAMYGIVVLGTIYAYIGIIRQTSNPE